MKLINLTCPNCGGTLQTDGRSDVVTCCYCGSQVYLDHESLFGSAAQAEQAGYAFERGRQRARIEMTPPPAPAVQQPVQPQVIQQVVYVNQAPAEPVNQKKPLKKGWLMLALTFFFGWTGIQWFISGRIGKGFLYLFTFGLFYFGWFYDVIVELIYCIKLLFTSKSNSVQQTFQ